MKRYKIAVIGGGAAGLFAAAYAAKKGMLQYAEDLVVIEKMGRCGRKINITGKGRCNLTNTRMWDEFAPHIHPQSNFLKTAFYTLSTSDTMDFFTEAGLPLAVERGQRVFPKSMRAMDVTDTLVNLIKNSGTEIVTDAAVESVKRDSDGFCTSTKKGVFYSDNLIIATGGLSYPSTGSSGDGYRIAESLGHRIEKCFPSLTALVPKNYFENGRFADLLCGLELKNISAALSVNGNIAQEEFGDLNFTDGGIEGPVIFRISRKAVESIANGQKVSVLIDLKPALSEEQIKARIERELDAQKSGGGKAAGSKLLNRRELNFLLKKLMPYELIDAFLKMNSDLSIANLSKRLKEMRFDIVSYVGYERCVVTAGGVSLKEVSQKTMESKLVKGLYFAGELLDLDGDTGGYNLQTAFSTAALAVTSILCK